MSGTIRIPIQALAVGNRWKYEQLREEEGVSKSAPDLDNWVWLCYWHTFAPEACEKKARLLLQRKTLRRLAVPPSRSPRSKSAFPRWF